MPVESGYQQQVAPPQAVPLPEASPAAFGAGVGAGIAQLGGAMHEADLRAFTIERKLKADQESTGVAATFGQQRLTNDQALEALKTDPTQVGAGGAGYTDAVKKMLAGQKDGLLGGITEASTRQATARQFDDYANQTIEAAQHYELGSGIGKSVNDFNQAVQTSRNRISSNPGSYEVEGNALLASLSAIKGLTVDQHDKMVREVHAQQDLGLIQGNINRGAGSAMVQMIDAGHFDGTLSPEERAQMRLHAETEVRRQDAIAQHQASLAKQAAVEQFGDLKARVAAGQQVKDSDFSAAEMALAGTGAKDGQLTQLHAMRVQSAVNTFTQPWTPEKFTSEIQTLQAKGTHRTPDEDTTLQQLQTIAPGRIAEFRKDTGSWAAMNGMPPPTLNASDPGSIAARKQWQASVAKTTGTPPPFLQPQEAATLQQQLASGGPQGRVAVADQLGNLGGLTAYNAARQVAPDDHLLQRMVLLQPTARAAAMEGAAARKTHPELVDGRDQGATVTKAFQDRLGPAANLLDQNDVAATLDIARNIYADTVVKAGWPTGDRAKWNTNLWNTAIHRALGGTRDAQGGYHGGVGSWNGVPVLLPSSMSQDRFDQVLTRMNWPAGSAVAPYTRDGAAMTPAQVRSFTPIVRSDGRYEFHGPNNVVLHDKRGGIWSVDPVQLSQPAPHR